MMAWKSMAFILVVQTIAYNTHSKFHFIKIDKLPRSVGNYIIHINNQSFHQVAFRYLTGYKDVSL